MAKKFTWRGLLPAMVGMGGLACVLSVVTLYLGLFTSPGASPHAYDLGQFRADTRTVIAAVRFLLEPVPQGPAPYTYSPAFPQTALNVGPRQAGPSISTNNPDPPQNLDSLRTALPGTHAMDSGA